MNSDNKSLILKYKDHEEKRDVFVETGTALGETTLWAARYFTKVYSIEFQENNYVSSFQKLWNIDNIKLFWGDSSQRLKDVAWMILEPAVFFLDAHHTNGEADIVASSGTCPIMMELGSIFSRPYNNIIFIDDARLFGIELGWPNISDIEDFSLNNGYKADIIGDMIIVSRNGVV